MASYLKWRVHGVDFSKPQKSSSQAANPLRINKHGIHHSRSLTVGDIFKGVPAFLAVTEMRNAVYTLVHSMWEWKSPTNKNDGTRENNQDVLIKWTLHWTQTGVPSDALTGKSCRVTITHVTGLWTPGAPHQLDFLEKSIYLLWLF